MHFRWGGDTVAERGTGRFGVGTGVASVDGGVAQRPGAASEACAGEEPGQDLVAETGPRKGARSFSPTLRLPRAAGSALAPRCWVCKVR